MHLTTQVLPLSWVAGVVAVLPSTLFLARCIQPSEISHLSQLLATMALFCITRPTTMLSGDQRLIPELMPILRPFTPCNMWILSQDSSHILHAVSTNLEIRLHTPDCSRNIAASPTWQSRRSQARGWIHQRVLHCPDSSARDQPATFILCLPIAE